MGHLHLDLEGDKPVRPLPGDGHVFHRPLDRATVPELDPADHGQIDQAFMHFEALGIPEAVGKPLLAIARRGMHDQRRRLV